MPRITSVIEEDGKVVAVEITRDDLSVITMPVNERMDLAAIERAAKVRANAADVRQPSTPPTKADIEIALLNKELK